MGLKDIGETLPPGFRFNPSDEELICHYLFKKIANEEGLNGSLMEIDLHTCEPWQLPGMRKTLVFYLNRAPNGIKTCWIMHEFRLESPHAPPKEDWVLCRVFYKSKEGENTSSTSPITTPPPNTFQNNIKPNVVTTSSQNKNPNNNNISIHTPLQNKNRTFHEHSLVQLPCKFQQPHIINMPPLTPDSVFPLFAIETNIVHTPNISIAPMHDHISHDIYNKDYDELKFSWDVKEDEKYDMDIVSTLEDQLGFELDDNSMIL